MYLLTENVGDEDVERPMVVSDDIERLKKCADEYLAEIETMGDATLMPPPPLEWVEYPPVAAPYRTLWVAQLRPDWDDKYTIQEINTV